MTRHPTRLPVVVAASVAFTAYFAATACDKPSPVAPSEPNVAQSSVITALRIEGNLRLAGPNLTSQLRAIAVMSTGADRDVTRLATWQMIGAAVGSVSETGLLTSYAYGTSVLTVRVDPVRTNVNVRVMPDGAHAVSGFVREPGAIPVVGAVVEVVDGPSAGRSAETDSLGRFSLTPVAGDVVTVRIARRDYVTATQQLTLSDDLPNLELALVPVQTPIDMSGAYQVTVDASEICELPQDVRTRRYTAAIRQDGARLNVTLSGATFRPCYAKGPVADHFDARISWGSTVIFELGRDDETCERDVWERISDTSYLRLTGGGSMTTTGRTMSGIWLGDISLLAEPVNGRAPEVIASCYTTHKIKFER